MKRHLNLPAVLFALIIVIGYGFAGTASAVDKSSVKAAMTEYIEAKSIGGFYGIAGVVATFDYIHTGVAEKDGLYVSCADFKADKNTYDIDYYVKEEGGKYVVVKEVFHKKDGKKVNRVLWSEKEK